MPVPTKKFFSHFSLHNRFLNPIIGVASPKAFVTIETPHFAKSNVAKMQYWILGLIGSGLSLLAACSTPSIHTLPYTTQRIVNQAHHAGFSHHRYSTATFKLTTYEHLHQQDNSTIHVYIEGDGNSWKTKYKLSDNPTPRQPLALTLALEDPHSEVVYLARPCQYTPHDLDPSCQAKYWSSHRYAPEVIQAMSEVLDQIKAKTKNHQFILIGFSGGGSVATLLAAERKDVIGLITVAGDLNHAMLNEYHQTSPLNGSLNPVQVASLLKQLPQQHWSGDRDPVVPCWVAENFSKQVGNPACVKVHCLKGVSHHRGWKGQWKTILKTPLQCDR